MRFINHKSSQIGYGKGQRGITREYFFEDSHRGLARRCNSYDN